MKKVLSILLVTVVILVGLVSCNVSDSTTKIVNKRINQIRTAKNTDISGRTGKVYYLSLDGDDGNDGLSPETAWKSLQKLNDQFGRKKICPSDSVLFRRGDVFRGCVRVYADDVLLGNYGNEKLAKPQICVSPWDGAKVGEWTLVSDNIWKYTVDGNNPFAEDVGVIWGIDSDGAFTYTQKLVTLESFDEQNFDVTTLLTSDLQFYQTGHPYAFNNRAQELYLYSPTNPQKRFAHLEFAIAKAGISIWNWTNVTVDGLDVRYAGIHGISAGTVANLVVTNCEFSHIGGAVQKYEPTKVTRYGNGVEVYGSVTEKNGYQVVDGYVVKNNYVHDIYDAGLTFQLSTDDASPVEKVVFADNVVERCVYNVEYWNNCWSKDDNFQQQTYINDCEISNNIFRYAGYGVCQTRPDKNQSAHIKTWKHNVDNFVKGRFVIENNIFDTALEHVFYIYAVDEKSLPQVKNNKFYNNSDVPFGYFYCDKKVLIAYDLEALSQQFPQNSFFQR